MPSHWKDDSRGWLRFALAPLMLLGGFLEAQSAHANMPDAGGACRVETVGGHQGKPETYTICSFDPATHRFSVRLRDGRGEPFGKLSAATDAYPGSVFAMNGGMYHDDLGPVGLYVEEGKRAKRLQTRKSWGNFGLLPNGVFWIADGQARVTETRAFAKGGAEPDFATQSGPMLVIDGKLHPRFLENSKSYKIRNGVGVAKDGTVHFAMSHGAVNFWTFAKLFQDHLDTPNALFLDGTVSAVRAKGYSRGGFWVRLGPIILAEPIASTASPADAAGD